MPDMSNLNADAHHLIRQICEHQEVWQPYFRGRSNKVNDGICPMSSSWVKHTIDFLIVLMNLDTLS